MINQTTTRGRLVAATIAAVAGILMFTVVPIFGQEIVNEIVQALWGMFEVSGDPTPRAAIDIASIFMPLWIGLTAFAGGILLLMVKPIYEGKYWARPIALGLVATASITGAYMFGPVMNSTSHLAPKVITIILVGLVPFVIFFLAEKSGAVDKVKNITLFVLLGILCAFSFTNGFSGLHNLASRVEPRFYEEATFFYAYGFPIIWVGVFLVVAGIPLLAGRSKVGWWLTVTGVIAMVVMLGTFAITNPNPFFIGNFALSLIVLLLLYNKGWGKRLITEPNAD